MKLFFTFLCVFLSVVSSFGQTCLPEGIRFYSQTQIDSFAILYPECLEILGDVTVNDHHTLAGDISNLDGLDNINTIQGNLIIQANEGLTDITGLSNLNHIGGTLEFVENNSLTNLNGLQGIDRIFGNLRLSLCPLLSDISGLSNVVSIGGHLHATKIDISNFVDLSNISSVGDSLIASDSWLSVNTNESLTSLDGLENMITPIFGGYILIRNNPLLTDIDALSNLQSVERLEITRNAITNLNALSNLRVVNYRFRIEGNNNLLDLTGLENLEYAFQLYIYRNDAMTTLHGLNSPFIERLIIVYNDTLNSISDLSQIKTTSITITGNSFLQNLDGLEHIEALNSLRIDRTSLSDFSGLNNLRLVNHIVIYENNSLLNFNGLNNLRTVGTFTIGFSSYDPLNMGYDHFGNESLVDLSGLEQLEYINILKIENNPSLNTIYQLNHVDGISELTLTKNDNLSICHAQSICNYLSSGGASTIELNNFGCNTPAEILENCLVSINTSNLFPDLTILPNPNSGTFQVEGIPRGTYNLLNTKGQLIQSGQLERGTLIDISEAAQGVYFIQMMIDEQMVTRRIIKL